MTTNEELANRHAHHVPANDKVGLMHGEVRLLFTHLSTQLNDLLPDCREKSLMLTKLDEARMWGNAAVALHQVEKAE